MAITQKSIKLLWSAAAGRCAFPDCEQQLTFIEAGEYAPYTLGEMAHICGDRPRANRHSATQTPEERDGYKNLILLCPTHHTMIDRPENEEKFPVDRLLQIKANHEALVSSRLNFAPMIDKSSIARQISPLLAENYQAWLHFGPQSKIARKNPHSEAAHAAWLSERLTTIAPNNRRISEILKVGSDAFAPEQQKVVASFLIHARSYERWVQDEISYDGVIRFPVEFEALIKESASAGE